MKTYDSYKDSSIQWIGEIPEYWEIVKIKYMPSNKPLSFIDGDWIESKDIIFDEGIRYITTGNIGEGKYKEQGSSFISEETFSKLNCTEVFPGDLLISRLNKPIGRSCIVPDLGNRIVTSVDNVIFRPNEKYLKGYLNFLMNNSKYSDYTELIARGATMQRISRGLLAEIKLPVPPLTEQTAIANYLDTKTTEIDQIIADKEVLINLYEEEKKALINEAVTKGVTLSGVETSAAKHKPSGIDWLGYVPEHWEVKKIKHTTYLKARVGWKGLRSDEFLDEGFSYLITGTDIKDGKVDFANAYYIDKVRYDDDPFIQLKINDLLITKDGTIGKLAIVDKLDRPACLNSGVFVLRTLEKKWQVKFLFFILSSNIFKSFIDYTSYGSTILHLYQNVFNEFQFPLPPLEEQTAIVRHIEFETTKINDKINLIKQEIELLKEYRQALIFEAVTGKIRVH